MVRRVLSSSSVLLVDSWLDSLSPFRNNFRAVEKLAIPRILGAEKLVVYTILCRFSPIAVNLRLRCVRIRLEHAKVRLVHCCIFLTRYTFFSLTGALANVSSGRSVDFKSNVFCEQVEF